jgi:AcrR family transcriptional regulator
MAPAGRRPGPGTSSEDILTAARGLFARHGYQGTTVRAIASEAGVTPAMIHHFFGGKRQVFLAAVHMPIDPAEIFTALLDGPREEFPQRFVHTFIADWSNPATGPALSSVLRSAMTDDEQAAALRTFAGSVMLTRIAADLAVPPDRMAVALSIMLGAALTRSILGVEQLAALSDAEVVKLYVPAVRAALFG